MQNDKKAKVDDSDDSDDFGEQDDWDNDSESDWLLLRIILN